MNKEYILNKMKLAGIEPGDDLKAFIEIISKEEPIFQFALREDLKDDERFLPTKAEPEATGYDCRAAQEDRKDIVLRAGQYCKIPLGFRCFCPDGWWYILHPRSSMFAKKYMHNLIGIIDETWEGFTQFAGQYVPDISSLGKDLTIKFGDPIAQIIPYKKEKMIISQINNKELDDLFKQRNAIRKSGGFGSTHIK